MKIKAAGVWALVVALLLVSLSALSFLAGQKGYGNLLLVRPSVFGQPGLSAEQWEEFSEEEFLLTYEIRQPATAQAVQSKHSVTVVGTNPHFADIMGYAVLDGGFFTKAAMDAKGKHAVLNETAAFQMFGGNRLAGSTLKLNGETWMIVGVIRDDDEENARIYVPAGVADGQVDSVMVLMDGTSVTEAYVKNAVKRIGIHDTGYEFLNLSKSAGAFEGRFDVAWKTVLLVLILFFVLASGEKLLKKLRVYRSRMRELYARDLLVRHGTDLVKTAGGILLSAVGIGAMLVLSLQILETCLTWQELGSITGKLNAGDFDHKLLWLRDYQLWGWVVFGACVCLTLLCLILTLSRRRKTA